MLDDLNGFADDHSTTAESIGLLILVRAPRSGGDEHRLRCGWIFLAAAIAAFEDAVNETGTALAGGYNAMAVQLRTTAQASRRPIIFGRSFSRPRYH